MCDLIDYHIRVPRADCTVQIMHLTVVCVCMRIGWLAGQMDAIHT